MFEFGGVGAFGGGVLGVAVGVGAIVTGPVSAPIIGTIYGGAALGAMIGGLGGVCTGSVFDILEKDSEVTKVTKEKDVKITEVTKEKDAEVIKLAKEKDAKIAQVNKEKDDLEKEKDTRIANLEKNQADHAEVNKKLSEKLDRVVSSDIGTLYTEVEQQKLINKIFADRINTLEEEKKILTERVENLENENKKLKEKILNLENEKKQIEAKNLDLENRIEEFKIKLKNSEDSRIDTIQKLAINTESLIINSGNQLTFILKEINSIWLSPSHSFSKSKDGVLNSLKVQQEFLNKDLAKEIDKWLPNKDIQLKIQDLILIAEEFIKMEKSDFSKIKNKSGETCHSARQIFANLAFELRDLREQEFELIGKKPENNRISNDKDVLRFLDQWEISTEFNVLNFIISEVNQITNNQIAVNS